MDKSEKRVGLVEANEDLEIQEGIMRRYDVTGESDEVKPDLTPEQVAIDPKFHQSGLGCMTDALYK